MSVGDGTGYIVAIGGGEVKLYQLLQALIIISIFV